MLNNKSHDQLITRGFPSSRLTHYHLAHLFLVVLDRQFESRQVVVAILVQYVGVIFVVEDHLQLSGAPGLVQQVLRKLLTLL